MKLCKIVGLNVTVKIDKSKNLPIMTDKWGYNLHNCDRCEVQLSRSDPHDVTEKKTKQPML